MKKVLREESQYFTRFFTQYFIHFIAVQITAKHTIRGAHTFTFPSSLHFHTFPSLLHLEEDFQLGMAGKESRAGGHPQSSVQA